MVYSGHFFGTMVLMISGKTISGQHTIVMNLIMTLAPGMQPVIPCIIQNQTFKRWLNLTSIIDVKWLHWHFWGTWLEGIVTLEELIFRPRFYCDSEPPQKELSIRTWILGFWRKKFFPYNGGGSVTSWSHCIEITVVPKRYEADFESLGPSLPYSNEKFAVTLLA